MILLQPMQRNQRKKLSLSDKFVTFFSNWGNSLNVHLSRIHSNIEQLDGHVEDFEDE